MATAYPLVGENEFVQVERLLMFLSPNFESDRLMASTKGYTVAILRNQVCPSSNKDP